MSETVQVTITHRGTELAANADEIRNFLIKEGVSETFLSTRGEDDVRLGAGEIIITLALAPAAKAAGLMVLELLESYFRQMAEKKSRQKTPKSQKLQIVLRTEGGRKPERAPISLTHATGTVLATFFKTLREKLSKL
jgi:hypothetical protein